MPETAFAFVDNSPQDSGGLIAFSSSDPLLPESEDERIQPFLEQAQRSAARITETSIDYQRKQTGTVYDFISMPPQARPRSTFDVLQEWEGYVVEKEEREFTARLLDLTAGSSHEEEEAVIPLREISKDDRKRLCPGSIFRWIIAYECSASGTRQRVSRIVFRDLPVKTEQDVSEGKAWARKIAQSLVD